MNYNEALVYIEKSYQQLVRKDNEIFQNFLDLLDNPEKKLKFIHIAGTNGKGSVSIALNNILIEQGYKVGLFTSPHIEKYNERLQINNIHISNEDFAKETELIKKISRKIFLDDEKTLTFFEIFTLMCFDYFSKNNVDFVILEAGIGGLLDCTNIIENPILSVITSISLDHVDILGNQLTEIGMHKAGIIKNNCPTVLYLQDKEVYNVFKETANKKNSKLYYLDDDLEIKISRMDLEKTVFSIKHKLFSYNDVEINLLGEYQIYNMSLVILCVQALRKTIKIDDSSIFNGLKKTKWNGRMELLIINNRKILLEGAHNLDAIEKLKSSINYYLKDYKLILVIGILSDKDYKSMVKILEEIPCTLIFTKPENSRAIDPNELKKMINTNSYIIEDYKKAIDKALELADNETIICVSGSLYLIGNVRTYLLNN